MSVPCRRRRWWCRHNNICDCGSRVRADVLTAPWVGLAWWLRPAVKQHNRHCAATAAAHLGDGAACGCATTCHDGTAANVPAGASVHASTAAVRLPASRRVPITAAHGVPASASLCALCTARLNCLFVRFHELARLYAVHVTRCCDVQVSRRGLCASVPFLRCSFPNSLCGLSRLV